MRLHACMRFWAKPGKAKHVQNLSPTDSKLICITKYVYETVNVPFSCPFYSLVSNVKAFYLVAVFVSSLSSQSSTGGGPAPRTGVGAQGGGAPPDRWRRSNDDVQATYRSCDDGGA